MKIKFSQKHPYIAAVLAALLCTFMTALGMAVSQIMELNEINTYFTAAAFLAVSVIFGIIILKRFKDSPDAYGFCRNRKGSNSKILWYLPIFLMELLPVAVYGIQEIESVIKFAALLIFTIAVGFNEEIYFRGIALNILKIKGTKKAIIGSSVIFGVLHAVNLLNGRNIFYVILQITFAFLVGLVMAQIVSITGTLWGVILWHTCHDFISYVTSDTLEVKALVILAIQVIVLLGYCIYLWKSDALKTNDATI